MYSWLPCYLSVLVGEGEGERRSLQQVPGRVKVGGVVGDGGGGRGWTCWETTVINMQLNTPCIVNSQETALTHFCFCLSISLGTRPSHLCMWGSRSKATPPGHHHVLRVYVYTCVFIHRQSQAEIEHHILFILRCIAMFDTLLCRHPLRIGLIHDE